MNTIIRYLVLLGLLLGVTSVSAQNANFRSFRETKGMVTSKSKDVYVWGPWEQSSTIFAMNFTQKSIIVKDQLNNKETKYAIYDKQQKWTSKKDYKYTHDAWPDCFMPSPPAQNGKRRGSTSVITTPMMSCRGRPTRR